MSITVGITRYSLSDGFDRRESLESEIFPGYHPFMVKGITIGKSNEEERHVCGALDY